MSRAETSWVEKSKLSFDWQSNTYSRDNLKWTLKDTAYRVEFKWDRALYKFKTYYQRAGPNFVSWNSLNLAVNQYRDNLVLSITA